MVSVKFCSFLFLGFDHNSFLVNFLFENVFFFWQFTFNVIVKQVLGLTPEDSQTARILEDFHTFMRGLISLPLYIPGTPYARAVKVLILSST